MTPVGGPALLLFLGPGGPSAVERLVAGAQAAVAADTLERAVATGAFSLCLAATSRADLELPPGVALEPDREPFHFGQTLARLIRGHGLERPFYVGGGSLALLLGEELGRVAAQLAQAQNTVIANNLYSADLVAFTPGAALGRIALPVGDNSLPQLLMAVGLAPVELPRTFDFLFDVDTPADFPILALHPQAGPRARAFAQGLGLDLARLRRALACLTNRDAQVVIAGRVGSYLWARLEADTACRVRLLAEERGLQADGRLEKGEARSILGFYLEEVGVGRFFAALGELGDAAFLDTRVLLAHFRRQPSQEDRFLSDLGRWQEIGDPFLRDLTRAAGEASIPVLLGGHSLVAGGLLALVDAAWRERGERPKRR